MDIGAPELIIVLVIVVLIFGPGRILRVSRELGEGLRSFRQSLETHSEQDKPDEN